jgi:hypothetical protein
LREKADDIARDEDLREPFLPDEGVVFAGGEEDDAPEDHVYGGGEEGWGEEQEEGLHDEGA